MKLKKTIKQEIQIEALITEYINFRENEGVFFDVKLTNGAIKRLSIAELFEHESFLSTLDRKIYGHLCYRKGYAKGKFIS